MMDDEVCRLRRLQSSAMRVIAIDAALIVDASPSGDGMLPAAGAAARRVARIVRESLQRHPNLRYRRGASRWERWSNRVAALRVRLFQSRTGGPQRIVLEALTRMSRQVNDVRALTWSQDLSDRLARIQVELRSVTTALEGCAATLDTRSRTRRPLADGRDALVNEATAREASG